ncbi:hypothetical protein RRF57_002403 [Xylaria bambusicola]|uniref:Phosphoribosylaminoimidazole-succinocarboxamide synthase n=1 Tax=Xylaria bambusicola TaxID=326684 RepID=A0AAN7USS9_9PEZI
MATSIVTSVGLKSLPLVAEGKVREIYEASNDTLLLVASDRISAYDVVLENGVQDKGTVLTLLTNHWLNAVLPKHVPALKHHLVSLNIPRTLDLSPEQRKILRGRSMVVRKYRVFPIEAIVRGYITGSSWSEYKQKGTVHGMSQPSGLEQCQAFPGGPIYTPSSKPLPSLSTSFIAQEATTDRTVIAKAPVGGKDENITPDHARQIVGDKYADKIESLALAIYKAAHRYALEKGIIVADTKFEFGLDEETDEVVLIDEVLLVLSPRPFGDAYGRMQLGHLTARDSGQLQTMRQGAIRRALTAKASKGRKAFRAQTSAKYLEAFQRLTGESLDQALAKLEN